MNDKDDSGATVTVRMTFPMVEWEKWDDSCKKSFGDVRWLKAMSDHKNASDDFRFGLINQKIDDVLALYAQVVEDNKEKSDASEKIGVLGNGGIEE